MPALRQPPKKQLTIEWESSAPWITPALVRAARGILGWSQRDLATRAGVTVSTVVSFERGLRDPNPPERMQIVFAFSRAKVRFCRSQDRDKRRQMVGVQLIGDNY